MKASEAIIELQNLIEKYGDREILYDTVCVIEGFDPLYCTKEHGFEDDFFNAQT